MRPSKGGGQIKAVKERSIVPADIALPAGYVIEPVISGLTFPSGITFDERGRTYVIEAGYSYGEVWQEPILWQIENNGQLTIVAKGGKNGPWTGVTFYQGNFYVAEGGEAEGGRILKITPEGRITALVSNLPSVGDHHTNGPVIIDGYLYFGQGTATNSGIVGPDNKDFGWLTRKPDFHDIPCDDIFLSGQNYESENVLADDPNDKAITGAYSAFNTSTKPGEVIKGQIPCSGSILRLPIEGGELELVAWGFRNPYGLAVSPNDKLYITENGYDDRGSRPVWGAGDALWEIQQGLWYGWPDFSAGRPIQADEEFKVPGKPAVKPLLQEYPNTPPKPTAILGVHSSSNGFDFSTNAAFGHKGQAFIAQFGDMAPDVGKVMFPVGFKIVRVNVENGVVEDFAVNKGARNGPASWLEKGGLERPLNVKFSPDGKALYIVDFGIMKMTKKGPEPQVDTGMIWKVKREDQ
ncbi:MAG: PQQ-dependent sugar dehydrogenase [Anditalea sp.]